MCPQGGCSDGATGVDLFRPRRAQALASCLAGTEPQSECNLWSTPTAAMTKPQCLTTQVTSTCTPTHSGACAALSTSGDCDAHASCTWSDSGTAEDTTDDACMTTTAYATCTAEVSNGQTACQAAGATAGDCSYDTSAPPDGALACANGKIDNDGVCPADAYSATTGITYACVESEYSWCELDGYDGASAEPDPARRL